MAYILHSRDVQLAAGILKMPQATHIKDTDASPPNTNDFFFKRRVPKMYMEPQENQNMQVGLEKEQSWRPPNGRL